MLDVGCWMLDIGCWILDIGYWMLDIGCWMLDARLTDVSRAGWILDIGFLWLIVFCVLPTVPLPAFNSINLVNSINYYRLPITIISH
jgi:hypothetical protein